MNTGLYSPSSSGTHDSTEFVIWEGKPVYLSAPVVATFVLIGLLFLVLTLPTLLDGDTKLEAGLPAPIISLIYTMYFVYILRGTRYSLTSRRVLTKRPIFFLGKREKSIPLSFVTSVDSKHIFGTKAVEFRISGKKSLRFGMLRDDPETVKQIALKALSEIQTPSRRNMSKESDS